MAEDRDRMERITAALDAANLDGLICTLPENVLLLSGYWPVVGTSVAVATRSGRHAVLAPEDEEALARHGWAPDVRTYQPGALHALITPPEAVREPLAQLLGNLDVATGRLGFEDMSIYEPSTYAAMYLFQANIQDVLKAAAPSATLIADATPIVHLRSALTPREVGRVRLGCEIAGSAFVSAARGIRAGQREPEVAAAFAVPMQIEGLAQDGVERAGAYTWCMSGPNSADAGAAFARTQNRELRSGDLVLVHCNSYIDGYWTDITRTYCLGEPDERQQAMYGAISAARDAALRAIRPGARAANVDRAARDILTERGFGQYFTHGIGHNVGFSAISADFPPRLHPASPDVLTVGMTFNIEPSIYIKSYGGIRHCDVVTVHEDGPEVLTPFQIGMDQLVIGG
ncbi:MAG: M24 family metallopeptidase [Chloroflexota bacterium]